MTVQEVARVQFEKDLNLYVQKYWDNINIECVAYTYGLVNLCLKHEITNRELYVSLTKVNLSDYSIEDVGEKLGMHMLQCIENISELTETDASSPKQMFFQHTASTWEQALLQQDCINDIFSRTIVVGQWDSSRKEASVSLKEKITEAEICINIKAEKNSGTTEVHKSTVKLKVSRKKVLIKKSTLHSVNWDSEKMYLYVPTTDDKGMVISDTRIGQLKILEDTPGRKVVEWHHGCLVGQWKKKSALYTITIKNGVPKYEEKSLPYPDWLEQMNTFRDLVVNPNNLATHHLLPDIPLYESDKIFITSTGDVYLNTVFGWNILGYNMDILLTSSIVVHPDILDACQQAALAKTLMK